MRALFGAPGATMNPTIDILRAELERLFSLDEMTAMSTRLLGLDPHDNVPNTIIASNSSHVIIFIGPLPAGQLKL